MTTPTNEAAAKRNRLGFLLFMIALLIGGAMFWFVPSDDVTALNGRAAVVLEERGNTLTVAYLDTLGERDWALTPVDRTTVMRRPSRVEYTKIDKLDTDRYRDLLLTANDPAKTDARAQLTADLEAAVSYLTTHYYPKDLPLQSHTLFLLKNTLARLSAADTADPSEYDRLTQDYRSILSVSAYRDLLDAK